MRNQKEMETPNLILSIVVEQYLELEDLLEICSSSPPMYVGEIEELRDLLQLCEQRLVRDYCCDCYEPNIKTQTAAVTHRCAFQCGRWTCENCVPVCCVCDRPLQPNGCGQCDESIAAHSSCGVCLRRACTSSVPPQSQSGSQCLLVCSQPDCGEAYCAECKVCRCARKRDQDRLHPVLREQEAEPSSNLANLKRTCQKNS